MINKEELENFILNITDETQNKKEKIFNDIQAEEIIFLKEKKVSQKNIIDFLFTKYPDLKINYENRLQTLKSLISKIKKEKTIKRRKKINEENVESNSSKSENKEEPENKSSDMLPKINNKKQERNSFIPPSSNNNVDDEEISNEKRENISNFFSLKK